MTMWTSERLEKAYALVDQEIKERTEAGTLEEDSRAEEMLLQILNTIEVADTVLEEES